jgi:hypothetical protein
VELIIIVMVVVAVFAAYHMGYSNGTRVGASRTQRELLRGATLGLSENEQNELAEQIGQVGKERPSASLRKLDEFVMRAFELGRLAAQANRHAGAAYQERATQAAMDRFRQ